MKATASSAPACRGLEAVKTLLLERLEVDTLAFAFAAYQVQQTGEQWCDMTAQQPPCKPATDPAYDHAGDKDASRRTGLLFMLLHRDYLH